MRSKGKQPRTIRFIANTAVDVPFLALENVHWRPQAAKFEGKYEKDLSKLAKGMKKSRIEKLFLGWRREETWVNHALNALFLAMPPTLVATIVAETCGGPSLKGPRVAKLDYANIRGVTGDPDLIVLDDGACVLGESKVHTHDKSAKYSFQQFTKFMALGAIVGCSSPPMRRTPVHLLIVPEADPKQFCQDYLHWKPWLQGGQLVVDPARVHFTNRNSRYQTYRAWQKYMRDTLLGKRVAANTSVDREAIETLLSRDEPTLVPTYVVTWTDLMARIQVAAEGQGLAAVAEGSMALLKMATAGMRGDEDQRRPA
jgi:hypothetical protein